MSKEEKKKVSYKPPADDDNAALALSNFVARPGEPGRYFRRVPKLMRVVVAIWRTLERPLKDTSKWYDLEAACLKANLVFSHPQLKNAKVG